MAIIREFIRANGPRGNHIIQTPTSFQHCIPKYRTIHLYKDSFTLELPTYNKLYPEQHTNPALGVVHSAPPRPPLVRELQGPPQ